MDSALNLNNPILGMFLVISFLSLLPAILVMFTSFTRIVVVLSFLRQAIGSQSIPPNPVIIGLSLFLTLFVMYPTVTVVNRDSIAPYMEKKITMIEAVQRAEEPVKSFMLRQTREKDIALFLKLGQEKAPASPKDLSMRIVVPAFAISELKTAFQIGFLLFLPFLIIDMVVASVLLSMGMMMLPPVMVSMPFKLLLFVLVDGWNLVVGLDREELPMTPDVVREIAGDAIRTFLMAAGPILLVSLVVGFLISLLQAVTQVQDFTLTFVPKILAVFACLLLFLPWMASVLIGFTTRIIENLPMYVR